MELSIPIPVPELPNVIPAHPWPSILLMKTVVITSIVVRFTLRAAPKKKGLKKVVANVIIRRRREGKKVVIISLIIFRFNAIVTRSPSPGYVALT